MSMSHEDALRRRAFQLAHISEELALASDRLSDQARAIAEAAAKLAETSAELVTQTPPPDDPDKRES